MAVKTFSTGEVLTASDTNTYLANAGLVVITPSSVTGATLSGAKVTVGTNVSSVTINGVFSSTYDNYKIVINGGTASVADAVTLKLGATATGYYFGMNRAAYDTGTANTLFDNNQTAWRYTCICNTDAITADIDLIDPYKAKPTRIHAWWIDARAGSYSSGAGAGYLAGTTSYTSFTLAPLTGGTTMTGATIMVYGYRLG